jgi:hypothetical protein
MWMGVYDRIRSGDAMNIPLHDTEGAGFDATT